MFFSLTRIVGLAEAALGEGIGGRLHKLSMKDIKFVSRYRQPFSRSIT